MNKLSVSQAVEALNRPSSQAMLTKESKSKLSSPQAIRLMPDVIVHRYGLGANAVGAGIKDLLLSSNNQREGISSFDGNQLEDLRNVVAKGIRFAFASDAAANKEASVKYSNFDADVPAALQNSVLHIVQNGKTIAKFAINDFVINGTKASQPKSESYLALDEPIVLAGGVNTQLRLEVPEGSTFNTATAAHYAYVELQFAGLTTAPSFA